MCCDVSRMTSGIVTGRAKSNCVSIPFIFSTTETPTICTSVAFVSALQTGSRSDDSRRLTDATTVSCLQDQAQMALCKHAQTHYPAQPTRFGKLLLMLSCLRDISSTSVVDIFFKKTIGDIPFDRLLVDVYKTADL